MEISEEDLINAIPSYLKMLEKENVPYPTMICTMGVEFGETEAVIKLTSLRHRDISISFYIPDKVKNKFIDMVRRIKNADNRNDNFT